jgi:hypothetical protein
VPWEQRNAQPTDNESVIASITSQFSGLVRTCRPVSSMLRYGLFDFVEDLARLGVVDLLGHGWETDENNEGGTK